MLSARLAVGCCVLEALHICWDRLHGFDRSTESALYHQLLHDYIVMLDVSYMVAAVLYNTPICFVQFVEQFVLLLINANDKSWSIAT